MISPSSSCVLALSTVVLPSPVTHVKSSQGVRSCVLKPFVLPSASVVASDPSTAYSTVMGGVAIVSVITVLVALLLIAIPFVISMKAMATAMFDPDLGLDYSRVVHGEQRFVYTRPVTAGDSLVCVASIDGIRSAAGNDLITVRSEISTEAGEHVVTTYATIVSRGTAEES